MATVFAGTLLCWMCQGNAGFQVFGPAHAEPAQAEVAGADVNAPTAVQLIGEPQGFLGTPVDVTGRVTVDFASSAETDYASSTRAAEPLKEMGWSGVDALNLLEAAREEQKAAGPGSVAERNLAAELSIAAPAHRTGLDFDISLAPRLTITEEGDLKTRRIGGEVRLGQGLSSLTEASATPEGWYVFAGADGEALVWDAGEDQSFGDLAMTDQITVGDMQAGVSIQRGGGQLSLSYIRREVRWSDRNGSLEENEDFAGFSFTRRY
jgi:hypothetical protein